MADTLAGVSISEVQPVIDGGEPPMTAIENVVRWLVIGGFAALLGFEAYMIWRAVILL